MRPGKRALAALSCAALSLIFSAYSRDARAVDLPKIWGKPLTLDLTDVTILTQRFDARTTEGELPGDNGFGFWINRLNAKLDWWRLEAGVRLDSSIWWRQPNEQASDPGQQANLLTQDSYRFPNTIYPAKLWLTYNHGGVEVTLGDSYVQFARGLVLSMRKIDDLGIDSTVRGAKATITKGPFAVTAVAGYANPSRVDEATAQTLFLQRVPTSDQTSPAYDSRAPHPVFGSDRIVAGEIQAGRGLPVVLATSAARITRCAPYDFQSGKIVDNGPISSEIGTCNPDSTAAWISSLDKADPTRTATEIDQAAQSIEFPKIGKFGNLFGTVATQRRVFDDPSRNGPTSQGTALYASYSGTFGPVTNTIEFKSYRNFQPVSAAVNSTRVSAFTNVAYSTPPTTEAITQDNLNGSFNACVDGGRYRADVRVTKHLITYFQAVYAYTKSEQSAGITCDKDGNFVGAAAQAKSKNEDYVWDGVGGFQFDWDDARSYLYSQAEVRHDILGDGTTYFHEAGFTYTLSKYLGRYFGKPVSVEVTGRHRNRGFGEGSSGQWHEGENYVALKIAPKWVLSQGFEYTTRPGYPTDYFNGGILYKITSDSNIKLFVGQQRGGLKCVNGVCRVFPAFEGARLEVTLRF